MNLRKGYNDIDILGSLYIEHIQRMVERLQDKIVVFDFDGTLTDFKYAENRLLPCRDDEIFEYSKTNNIYQNVRVLKTMQVIISQLNKENVFILTRTEETLVGKKNKVILENFSIFMDNVYHVSRAEDKLQVLNELHRRFSQDIIFVEDTFKTILNAEETMPFIRGIHISSFII